MFQGLVCPRGFEPPANGLEIRCSIRLSYEHILMERVMGIEPTQSAWKADVLPLNYTRKPLYDSFFMVLFRSPSEADF